MSEMYLFRDFYNVHSPMTDVTGSFKNNEAMICTCTLQVLYNSGKKSRKHRQHNSFTTHTKVDNRQFDLNYQKENLRFFSITRIIVLLLSLIVYLTLV